MREFNLILDLVSFVRDSSSAIDFERFGRDKFSKVFAGTLVNVLGIRARPREQRGSEITGLALFSESTTELISGQYGNKSAQLIYGTFTTPVNSISGSAVCAFSLQDITDTFKGNFKEQSAINSNWLPVQSTKVPDPRPGQCVNDSRSLPDLTLNFIHTHSLMDELVPSFFGQPIVIRTSFQ